MDLKSSAFRLWVHRLWIDNCDERQAWGGGDSMAPQEYFQRFRWWLRREWRHQQKSSKG